MTEYKLKFLFANHDGVNVEISLPETMTGLQVKQALLDTHWPPEDKVEKASGPAGIRLLCMGKMLDDNKTLADMKIPRYDHPTPVNVSLLPKGKTYSEHTAQSSVGSTNKTTTAATTTTAQTNQAGAGGAACCIIS